MNPRNTGILAMTVTLALATAVSPPTAKAGKINLLFLGKGPDPFSTNVCKLIHQQHPDITAVPFFTAEFPPDYKKLMQCDAFMGDVWVVQEAMNKGLLDDLRKWMPKKTLDGVPINFLEPYTIGKGLFAMPYAGSSQSFIYNRAPFRDAGLAFPDTDWKWGDQCLKAAGKLLRDDDGDGVPDSYGLAFMMGYGREYLSLFNGYGGKLTDAKGKRSYTRKPGLDALDLMLDMMAVKGMVPTSNYNLDEPLGHPFYQGKAAMWFWHNGREDWARIFMEERGAKLDVGMTQVPRGPKGSVPVITHGLACVFRNGRNKRDTAKALDYFMSTGFQLSRVPDGSLPTTIEALRSDGLTAHIPSWFVNSYGNGRVRGISPASESAEWNMWQDLMEVARGNMSRKEFVAKGSM